ncbi:MFS transporter [Clostridium sp. AM58-1XD]|uniref:MFS transporter n=1 Tax=Clostridium sp. AM58-1XD TaxID=2292307 RepID=UPI00325BCA51
MFFGVNFLYFALYVVRNTTVIYYFTYNLQKENWIAFVGLFGILSGLPMLLLLPSLQKKMGKKKVMYVSLALYIIGDIVIYMGRSHMSCLLGGLLLTGLGIYGIFGTTFAMQPDVIDYSEYSKKRSISGMIAALQGFFVKASMGIASAVIGLFLEMGGYIPNVKQSQSALNAIEVSFIWIPAVLCLLIAVMMIFYNLDSVRTDMSMELDRRRAIIYRERKTDAI